MTRRADTPATLTRPAMTEKALIAAATAERLGLPAHMVLFEADADKRESLRSRLVGRNDFTIYGDHLRDWRLVYAWHRPIRQIVDGLVYWDPFGEMIPVDIINGLIAKPMDKVDVLLHVNANGGYKRPRGRGHAQYQGRYLADDIARLDKRHWWIREPSTDWQWTFLIGSNWPNFPEFRRLNFHPLASDQGQRVLDRLNLSDRERREALPQLPFDLSRPTAPTPSTSVTPGSSKCGLSSCAGPAGAASGAAPGRQLNLTI